VSAHAYIGPGIAFLSYLLGPVAAIVVTVGLILYLPIKKIIKKGKKKNSEDKNAKDDDE